jgi:tetratricopeptide (TPR) repeat protein
MSSLRELIGLHTALDQPSTPGQRRRRAPVWPEQGQLFLHFSLRRLLGRGAFSRVYLATEPPLGDRLVAVKLSVRSGGEAATLGRLSHPNVVPVHSVQEDPASGLTVVCMPYHGSATLRHVLDRAIAGPRLPDRAAALLEAVQDPFGRETASEEAPPAPDARLRRGTYVDGVVIVIAQLADALAFIHAREVYHRDLKPSNVLMTPQGKPMLLDFNLAQDPRCDILRQGGTLPYMSPEQLRATIVGNAAAWAALDARSDLFSLGVILYELLTGHHPFGPLPPQLSEDELRAWLLERQERGPVPVGQRNPWVNGWLARVVARCLAADAGQRYGQAAELAAALRSGLSWRRRMGRWLVRRRTVIAAAGLLAALPAVYFLARDQASPTPEAVVASEPESIRLLKQGWAAYDQGQYRKAVAILDQATKADSQLASAWYARGRAQQKLRHFEEALGDFESAYRLKPDGRTRACQGHCASLLRRRDDAIGYYEEAIKAGYKPAEVYSNLGYWYLRLGRPRKRQTAKEYLDLAIQANPRLQAVHYLRAQADLKKALSYSDYFPKAGLEDIETALRLGPQTADLHYTAARLYAVAARVDSKRKEHLDRACGHLKKALLHGQHPGSLKTEFAILEDHEPFKDLLNWPVPKNPPRLASQLIDPVPEKDR